MTATLAAIYRHPVKSLGEEALEAVTLEGGRHMPWDRVWAIAHGGSAFDAERPEWVGPRNFVTQTFVPRLAQIKARYDEASARLALSHPDRPEITIEPESEEAAVALTEWIAPLAEGRRAGPFRLCRLPGGALTDFPDTHLSLNSTRSLAILAQAAGRPLEHIRFRANLWIDGLEPWEEFELIGREIAVGPARLRVTEPITRCNATAASPATGARDVAVPEILERNWGHMDFGVYAQVVEGGRIARGDPVARP